MTSDRETDPMSSVSFLNASEKHGAVFSKAMPYINAVADSISERHRLASASEFQKQVCEATAINWKLRTG